MDYDVIALNRESNKYCEMGDYKRVIRCCDKMLDYEPDNLGQEQYRV